MGSALVRVGVRQHAAPESISKRAQSTTLTSLRLESITCERPTEIIAHAVDFRAVRSISSALSSLAPPRAACDAGE